jgi:ABC-2 type transport system permease protein
MPTMTLIHKELLEQWRTRRFLVLGAVFLFFGLLSPITAKLTPEILEWAASAAPGMIFNLPPPSAADAVGQYVKNLSQMLPLVVLLVAMGSVASEKERGTLPMVLAKPVWRGAVLGCKFCSLVVVLAASLFLGGASAYYYSIILFDGPPLDAFLLMNLVAGLYLLVILALTFLASTLATSTVMAGALAFILWLVLLIVGAVPRIGRASPTTLVSWAARLGIGQAFEGEWLALGVSLGLIVASLALAWLHFRRQEL